MNPAAATEDTHSSAPAVNDQGPGEDEPGTLGALRNPQFLRFWIAVTLALTGLWVRITVQGYLVYELTDDELMLGLVGFLSAIPNLVLSPIVGVVVDRFERRKVLFVTQAFMATTLFTLATLDAVGALRVHHILI